MSETPTLADDPEAYWNEEAGPAWVALQADLDRLMASISVRLLAAASPQAGERVIDVGCGCGATTLGLAELVGASGQVTGVDLSQPMLDRASERAAGMAQVTFHASDAGTHAFEAGSTDLVVSRFGIMFFDDPVAAFSNLRRALEPQKGRLCFTAWQGPKKNAWITTPLRALPELPPPEPAPPGTPGPFSLADPAQARRVLEGAGFSNIELESVQEALPLGETPDDVLRLFERVGPLSRYLGTLEESERGPVIERVRRYLEEGWGTDAVSFGSAYWLVRATASP